jgi:hypothetical protein
MAVHKSTSQNAQPKKARSVTVGDVEKQYGMKVVGVRSTTTLATYLVKSGVPSLAKVLKKTERHLAH